MMITAATLPSARYTPVRPTASAVASAPADQVDLQSAPNPWPQLEKAGVLAANSSATGAIGSVITQTVREDLTRSLARMQAAGAKFEYRRRIALPFGLRGRYEELTPQKATDYIAKRKPDALDRLEITMPGVERRKVRSLKDLQLADGVLGASVLDANEKLQLDCLRSLEKEGFKARDGGYYYDEARPPMDQLEQLKNLSWGREISFTTPGGDDSLSAGKDSLVALDYFQGSGTDRGLKNPAFARQLKEAEKSGFVFRYDRRNIDNFRAYQIELKDSYVRKEDTVLVPVSKDDLADLGKLGQRIAEADAVYREVLAGAFKEAGSEGKDVYFPAVVTEGSQKFPPRVAAAVYGELMRASRKSGEDNYRSGDRIASLSKKLYQECATPFELARKSALVAATWSGEGYEAANKILSQTQQIIGARSASNPERQEQLEDLFFTLLTATSSISAASEGMDLVRIAVGSESQEDRTRLFQALARRLPAGSTDQTAVCYRTVLAERLPQESLQKTGERFCALLEGMAVGRHQDRAAEVFTYFQQQMRDGSGDPAQADAQVRQFLQNLVIHDDVDKALTASFGGNTSQGSVSQQDDAVVIGGVRVPRRG